jgi:L-ascorbate metabolism protein UlaG (beta-lactamase superfamily)
VDRVTYVGHATVLLELGGVRLLTDPVLRPSVGLLRRRSPLPAPAVTQNLDAALVSHLHFDHLDLPSLRRLGREVRLFAPRGAGRFLRRAGFNHVTELAVGETAVVDGLEVAATPALHHGRRRPLGPVAEPIGFEVRGDRRAYFAGDTDVFPGMAELAGGLDLALLPVWGWGPTLSPGHLGPKGAARAVELLRPRLALPIHWGTFFPAGLARRWPELLRDPAHAFAAWAAMVAPEVEVRVLYPGASLALSR